MSNYVPVRLAYKVFEPASGANADVSPMIFLHGITASKELWSDIPQNIANETKRKVYTLDARNHGESEWSKEFSFELNAIDLLHFMDTMKIDKAILVGHSMGGITSMKAAVKSPERIEKIVVEDMYTKQCPPELIKMIMLYISLIHNAFQEVSKDLDEESAIKFILDHVLKNLPPEIKGQQINKNPENFMKKLRREDGTYAFKCNIDVILRKMKDDEKLQSEFQGSYKGPAYFIYGKLSPFRVDTEEDHIKQHFPNAEFLGIDEASHCVHDDYPIEFTEAVLKFLS